MQVKRSLRQVLEVSYAGPSCVEQLTELSAKRKFKDWAKDQVDRSPRRLGSGWR